MFHTTLKYITTLFHSITNTSHPAISSCTTLSSSSDVSSQSPKNDNINNDHTLVTTITQKRTVNHFQYASVPTVIQEIIVSCLPLTDILCGVSLLNHELYKLVRHSNNRIIWQHATLKIENNDRLIHEFDTILPSIILTIPFLQSFTLSTSVCMEIDNIHNVINTFCNKYSSLTTLKLHNISNIDNDCITQIRKHLTALQTLHLNDYANHRRIISAQSIASLFTIPTLTALCLPSHGKLRFADISLSTVPLSLTALDCSNVDMPVQWWHIILSNTKLQSLKCLCIPGEYLSWSSCHLCSLTSLSVVMHYDYLVCPILSMLQEHHAPLKELSVDTATVEVIDNILPFTALQRLHVHNIYLPDASYDIEEIQQLHVLQQLTALQIDDVERARPEAICSLLLGLHSLHDFRFGSMFEEEEEEDAQIYSIVQTALSLPLLHTIGFPILEMNEFPIQDFTAALASHTNIHTVHIDGRHGNLNPPEPCLSLLQGIAATVQHLTLHVGGHFLFERRAMLDFITHQNGVKLLTFEIHGLFDHEITGIDNDDTTWPQYRRTIGWNSERSRQQCIQLLQLSV